MSHTGHEPGHWPGISEDKVIAFANAAEDLFRELREVPRDGCSPPCLRLVVSPPARRNRGREWLCRLWGWHDVGCLVLILHPGFVHP